MSDDDFTCTSNGDSDTYTSLRIASIFIIGIGSSLGALFPVLARRTRFVNVPQSALDFAKYFGSGVIIATAFIHLLAPSIEALNSDCLSPEWREYPYALALAMFSVFFIFIVELFAFRWGTAKLAKLGIHHGDVDAHGHGNSAHTGHVPEEKPDSPSDGVSDDSVTTIVRSKDVEASPGHHHHHGEEHPSIGDSPLAQIVGISVLEFGVLLHSLLIGLTLAVDPDFIVLFVVISFHQTFEGLGVGARLADMRLPAKYNWVPVAAAALFGLATPVGIAVGMGVRDSYNPGSATASIVSGVMDALSAGILIYTGLVELLAHEFLFNKEMINGSNKKLAYAIGSMFLGVALMSLLGRWA